MSSKFMKMAIKEALIAYKKGNTPVGAVIVKDDKVIAKAHNLKNTNNMATYHAEILAINKACKKLKTWRLNNCSIYVTLEPCKMCFGAITESRIESVFYILDSTYKDTFTNNALKINVVKDTNEYDYATLLNEFFKDKR